MAIWTMYLDDYFDVNLDYMTLRWVVAGPLTRWIGYYGIQILLYDTYDHKTTVHSVAAHRDPT